MNRYLPLALLLAVTLSTTALAQSKQSEEMGTPEQRRACSHDVGRFCKSVKPEEGPFAYLDCLSKNREKLRAACVRVIDGGQP
jgi:hypothetical protein